MPPTRSETQKDEEKIQQGQETEGGRVRKIERFVYGFQVDVMLQNRFQNPAKILPGSFQTFQNQPQTALKTCLRAIF